MKELIPENLLEFKFIIISLVAYASHPKLDYLINQLTLPLEKSVNQDTQLLIKMEIRRLATPCQRVMDFRIMFELCEEVSHNDISHYLDETSKKLFLENVDMHDGQYNLAIYNIILDQARARHRGLRQEKKNKRASAAIDQVCSFSLVNNNIYDLELPEYSSKCKVFTYDPLGMSLSGKMDIGLAGQLTSLEKKTITLNSPNKIIADQSQVAYIWLYDHHPALGITEEIVLECKVLDMKQSNLGQQNFYQLSISPDSHAKMQRLLSDLLLSRQKLYKREEEQHVQPLTDSIIAKSSEQFLLSCSDELALLCQKPQTAWQAVCGLQNDNNQAIWDFFASQEDNYLTRVLANPEIQLMLDKNQKDESYVYVLKQATDEGYEFAAIWQHQLSEPSTRGFLEKSAIRNHFRQFKVSIIPVDAAQDGYQPAAIPSYVSPEIEICNQALPKETNDFLANRSVLIVLTDVTDLYQLLGDQQQQETQAERVKIPLSLRLPAWRNKSAIEVIQTHISELRSQDRFDHSLAIHISRIGDIKCNLDCTTNNISSRGLSIALPDKIKIKPGEIIKLGLTIPYKNKNIILEDQGYQVVSATDQNSIRLIISGIEKKHLASKSIREFIYRNRDMLRVSGLNKNQTHGLQHALRSIYARNHISVPFFIHQDKRQWYIDSVALNRPDQLPSFSNNNEKENQTIINMLGQEKFRSICLAELNKNKASEAIYMLVFPRSKKEDDGQQFWFRDLAQLIKANTFNFFTNKINSLGQPSIFRIKLHQSKPIMDKYYRTELDHLKQIASDQAAQLEKNINKVVGVGEITDHTQQVLSLLTDTSMDDWTLQADSLPNGTA